MVDAIAEGEAIVGARGITGIEPQTEAQEQEEDLQKACQYQYVPNIKGIGEVAGQPG